MKKDIKLEAKRLIGNGNTKNAILKLVESFESIDKDKRNEEYYTLYDSLILYSSRYNMLSKKVQLGIIDENSSNIEKNKIDYGILNLINLIPDLFFHGLQYENGDSQSKTYLEEIYKTGYDKMIDYDYNGAIYDFLRILEVDEKNINVHFHLSCLYSVNENAPKSLFHLGEAVKYGFTNFELINKTNLLAYTRMQDAFKKFIKAGYKWIV